MYDCKRPHGLMFHYFHNDVHPVGQGSIDSEKFKFIIESIGRKYNLLSADEFFDRFISGKLDDYDVCITLDDNLRCQFDIAFPVLEEFDLKAFWFIYTSPLNGTFEKLELYRYYRSTRFDGFEDFYTSFFDEIDSSEYYHEVKNKLELSDAKDYLKEFPCYTEEDRIFRYTRDKILGEKKYFEIMDSMISKSELIENDDLHSKLWMDRNIISEIYKAGHLIGLHSHTHPTDMGNRSFKFQYENYKSNKELIEEIIQDEVVCMSHPCNSYNNDTLDILNRFAIKIGFRSNLKLGFETDLEVPRIEYSDIFRDI